MSQIDVNVSGFDRLQEAMKAYSSTAEKTVNAVLHEEAGPLIQDSIKNLIPVSGRMWKGKKAGAKVGKSLQSLNENLAVTVKTTKNYQYLYFPDDGSNTQRHAGNQQFFLRGAENKQTEIIDRCVSRLVSDFEKAVN